MATSCGKISNLEFGQEDYFCIQFCGNLMQSENT